MKNNGKIKYYLKFQKIYYLGIRFIYDFIKMNFLLIILNNFIFYIYKFII